MMGLSDADLFGQPGPAAPPVSVAPLPNVPGYVSDPSYTPPADATPAYAQAPAVPLGGPQQAPGLSDADLFGSRPVSQSLGGAEGLNVVLGNLSRAMTSAPPTTPLPAPIEASRNVTSLLSPIGLMGAFGGALSRQVGTATQAAEQTYRPGRIGKFVGETLASLPFQVTDPWGAGALQGYLTSEATSPGGLAADIAGGAVGGKVGDKLFAAVRGVAAPIVREAAQKAADMGISLPPGAILGGLPQKAENVLSKLPLLGPMIGNAQTRTLDDWNRATINERVLKPIGQVLPDHIPTGHEAVNHAAARLSATYNAIAPNLQLQPDAGLAQGLAAIKSQAEDLDGPYQARMNKILEKVVTGFTSGGGVMNGAAHQDLTSYLKKQAVRASASPDMFANEYGDLAGDLKATLMEAAARQNPKYAGQLRAVNDGWANLVRVEKAANLAKQHGGVFTPNDLVNAVASSDQSVRDNANARGQALMQDWANWSKQVVPNTRPTGASAAEHAMEGAVALGVGKEAGMPIVGHAGALAAALGMLYTKPGQKVATALMTKRPQFAHTVANALTPIGRPLAAIAGGQALPALLSPELTAILSSQSGQ